MSDESVVVGTRIPYEVFIEFKRWCEERGTKPGTVLRNYILELLGAKTRDLEERVRALEREVLYHDVYIYEIAKKTGVKLEKIAEKWFRKKPLPER